MTRRVLCYAPGMTPAEQTPELEPADLPESPHAALLREIAADARREPERYLADSIVPRGGE